jgi:hypothetical protein
MAAAIPQGYDLFEIVPENEPDFLPQRHGDLKVGEKSPAAGTFMGMVRMHLRLH